MIRTVLNLRDSIGDSIRLSLSDSSGNRIWLDSVYYTIYSSRGELVSGVRLPAIRKEDDGFYYAPWYPFLEGVYRIVWEYRTCCDDSFTRSVNYIVAMNPGRSGRCLPERDFFVPESSPSFPVYFTPLAINPNSFPIHFRTPMGDSVDPYLVQYSILDHCGRTIISTTMAEQNTTGHFYASFTSLGAGSYSLLWQWVMFDGATPETKSYPFVLISLCSPPWHTDPNGGQIVVPDDCCDTPAAGSCGCSSTCSDGGFDTSVCGTRCWKPCGC